MHVRHGLSNLACHLLISEEHARWPAALFEPYEQIVCVTHSAIDPVEYNVQLASHLLYRCVRVVHNPETGAKQVGQGYGRLALQHRVGLRYRRIRGARMDRQERVTHHTFCIDRYDGVGSNQAMKLLVDLHLDTKMTTWRTRYFDTGHLARAHACNLHLRALRDAIKICELGIQQHVARESLMTTPNEEDPESEQGHAGDDEDSYCEI